MSVHMVIAIEQPDTEPEWSVERENEAYAMAERAAEDLTEEMTSELGPGWKATLGV